MVWRDDSSYVRRSGLSLRVVAAVVTMVLLVACSAVTCLAGLHAGAGIEPGSQAHAVADADHLPHKHADVTSAPELLSGEGPAGTEPDTANVHVDRAESLRAGAEGCAHEIHDPRDGTLIRVAAPDLQVLHPAPGGIVRDSHVQSRLAVVQNASPVTPSIVQLSISRT